MKQEDKELPYGNKGIGRIWMNSKYFLEMVICVQIWIYHSWRHFKGIFGKRKNSLKRGTSVGMYQDTSPSTYIPFYFCISFNFYFILPNANALGISAKTPHLYIFHFIYSHSNFPIAFPFCLWLLSEMTMVSLPADPLMYEYPLPRYSRTCFNSNTVFKISNSLTLPFFLINNYWRVDINLRKY